MMEMNGGLKRRLVFGIGVQGITFAALMVLQLIIVPIYLSRWETVVYADWLVLQATASLLLITDLGLQGYLGNGIRLAWARGDGAAFHRTLQSGLGAYAALVGLAVITFLASIGKITALLNLWALESAELVLALLGLSVLMVVPRGIVSTIYTARGQLSREVSLNFVQLAGQLVTQAATVLAGGTPLEVAAAYLGATVLLGWGVLLADLRRQHSDIRLRPSWPTWEEWRRLLANAPLYAVPQSGGMLMLQVPVIALGQLAGSAGAVVAFTTMRTLTGVARQVASQVSMATGIEMVRQYAQHDYNGMLLLHAVTGRLIGAVTGLIAGPILVLGPAFFLLWWRGAIPFDPVLAAVFLGTILLMAPAYGALTVMRNSENPGPVAAATLIQVLVGTLLCVLLIPAFEATGAALAVGAAEVLALGLFVLRAAGRCFAIPILPFLGRTVLTTLISLALGTGVALAAGYLMGTMDVASLMLVLVVCAAALPLPAAFLLLTPAERTWLWNLRGRGGAALTGIMRRG